ncbi:hypothetical protein CCP3SC15_2010004 [Gammaproteobacteria bacterium]
MLAKSWQVSVMVDGEDILVIGDNHLSGVNNVLDFTDYIRNCAAHLAGFIGEAVPTGRPALCQCERCGNEDVVIPESICRGCFGTMEPTDIGEY